MLVVVVAAAPTLAVLVAEVAQVAGVAEPQPVAELDHQELKAL